MVLMASYASTGVNGLNKGNNGDGVLILIVVDDFIPLTNRIRGPCHKLWTKFFPLQ